MGKISKMCRTFVRKTETPGEPTLPPPTKKEMTEKGKKGEQTAQTTEKHMGKRTETADKHDNYKSSVCNAVTHNGQLIMETNPNPNSGAITGAGTEMTKGTNMFGTSRNCPTEPTYKPTPTWKKIAELFRALLGRAETPNETTHQPLKEKETTEKEQNNEQQHETQMHKTESVGDKAGKNKSNAKYRREEKRRQTRQLNRMKKNNENHNTQNGKAELREAKAKAEQQTERKQHKKDEDRKQNWTRERRNMKDGKASK